MVNRRHAKHTLAGRLERRDLYDHRQCLEHEDAADDHEKELLLDQDRDRAKRGPKRKRSDITHEDFGWVRVVPKEAERRADERAAENRQLGDRGEMNQQQGVGKYTVADDV